MLQDKVIEINSKLIFLFQKRSRPISVQSVHGHKCSPSNNGQLKFRSLAQIKSPFCKTWQNGFIDLGQNFKCYFFHFQLQKHGKVKIKYLSIFLFAYNYF